MALPGSSRLIEQLVHEHYMNLYRYAYRLAGSATEAEDLTQETFLKAQAHLGQLRDRDKAKPWLFSILRNAYLHRLRDERREPSLTLDALDELAETNGDVVEVDSEQLQKILNEMPEGFRTVLILYYFEDFSYRDIAEEMSLPLGTIMSRLSRAKAFLRSRLAGQTASHHKSEEGA